jgi:hypothetical protein
MSLSSHTGDGTVETTWPRRDVYVSHAGDDSVEATWSLRDVGADDHANVTPSLIYT